MQVSTRRLQIARAASGRADTVGQEQEVDRVRACHTPVLRTRSGTEVVLYSDLLLHDMGPALDDKMLQGSATGSEWRTAPLVSLHARARYLHDGRAANLHEAVLAHGGEAQIVRDRFLELDDDEQESVRVFLDRLR